VALILDTTSFYGEAGGQVADTGALVSSSGATLEVTGATVARGYIFHIGKRPDSAIKVSLSLPLLLSSHFSPLHPPYVVHN
jgi:alanyl-tRNA synthetase